MYKATVHSSVSHDIQEAEQKIYETSMSLTWNPPTWEKELQDITVQERDKGVELSCICRDLTYPSAKWFHKGREVFSDFHMKLKQVADIATLTIKDIRQQDSGKFKCIMSGENGELETSCILSIKDPERLEPPIFMKELHDVEVEEGEKLELDVEVRGTPPVGVFWYHNNVEITHNNPHFLLASLGQVHTLTLLNATSESSGEYVCEAYNDFGDTDTFCFVEVRELEHPEAPSFVSSPLTVTVQDGETVTFSCKVKGQPMPTVVWERGDVAISNSHKYKITKIQDQHTLTVYKANQTDAGEYICHLHSTEGDLSHVCSIFVDCGQQSREHEAAGTVQLRPSHIDGLYSTSQTDRRHTLKEENLSAPQEISQKFKHQKLKDKEDIADCAAGETLTTRTAYKTSFETVVGVKSTAFVQTQTQDSKLSNHIQYKHRSHPDSQSGSHDSKSDVKQLNMSTIKQTDNLPLEESEIRSNLPVTITATQPVVNKSYQKAEGKKNINTDVTDFRSVLKQREKSIPPQSAKSDVSQNIDFRQVLSQNKIKHRLDPKLDNEIHKKENKELVNIPTTQVSNTELSKNAEFSSVFHITSSVTSSTNHQIENQSLRNYKRTVNEHGLTSNQLNLTDIQSSSESTVEPSLTEKRDGRSRKNPTHSLFSVPNFDKASSNVQQIQATSSGKSVRELISKQNNDDVTLKNNILTTRTNQFEIIDMSKEHSTVDNLNDDVEEQHKSEPCDATKSGATLFKSEIQVLESRVRGRRGSATKFGQNQEQSLVSSSTVSKYALNQFSSKSCVSDRNILHLETEKLVPKSSESQQKSTLQFNNVNVNDCTSQMSFTPPMEEELKLEVTSISVSMPLRTSGSPRLHSWPHSISTPGSLPDQPTADNANTEQENTDDVFTKTSDSKRGSVHTEENSSIDGYRQSLQSLGSIFTWEKAPWDVQDVQEGIWPDTSTQDEKNMSDTTDSMNKSSNKSSLSENKLVSKYSLDSKSDSTSNFDSFEESDPSSSTGGDFRNIKLKPTANKNRSSLTKNKFMSASMECVFADIKLKPISKNDDKWRKSQISLSAGRVKDRPKSTVLSDLFPSSIQDISQKNIKTSNNATVAPTDNLKPTYDTKHKNQQVHSKYDKPVQNNKIKTISGKYDKSSATTVPKTNTYSKSKGIGAKFEASLKDSKHSNASVVHTSPAPAVAIGKDLIETKSQTSEFNSGRVSDKIQHWKAAEAPSSEKVGGRKMLGAIGKSNSNSDILESGGKSYLDKVQNRLEQKRHSLETNVALNLPTNSQKNVLHRAECVTLTKRDELKTVQDLDKITEKTETADLKQISDVIQKEEVFANGYKNTKIDLKQTDSTTVKAEIVHDRSLIETTFQTAKADILFDRNVKDTEINTVKADILHDRNKKETAPKTTKADILFDRNIKKPENSAVKADVSEIKTRGNASRQNKIAAKTVQNQQDKKPEWINRKPVNSIEAKIKANNTAGSHPDKTRPEWVSHMPSKNIKQAESTQESKNISKFELGTTYKNTNKSEQTVSKANTNIRVSDDSLVASHDSKTSRLDHTHRRQYGTGDLKQESRSLFNERTLNSKPVKDAEEANRSSKLKTVITQSNDIAETTTSMLSPAASLSVEATAATSSKLVSTSVVDVPSTSVVDVPTTIITDIVGTAVNSINSDPLNDATSIAVVTDRRSRRSDSTVDQIDESELSNISNNSSHVLSSKVLREEVLEDNLSRPPSSNKLLVQVSTESPTTNQLSHMKSGRSTWMKQKNLRSIPLYPSHETDIPPHHELLVSSMDDSESVLSTASISSSSSDASNVTVDSGYARNISKNRVDNEKINLSYNALRPEDKDSFTKISHARKVEDLIKSQAADSFITRNNLSGTSEIKEHFEHLSKLNDTDGNIQISTSGIKQSRGYEKSRDETSTENASKFRKFEAKHHETYSTYSDELEQTRSRQRILAKESTDEKQDNYSQISKGPESVTDLKENDVADLSNDFGTTRKYSKKRRKQLQKDGSINTGLDNAGNRPVSSTETEEFKPTHSPRFRSNNSRDENMKVMSDIRLESDKATHQWQSEETVTNMISDSRESEPELTRRSRFRQKLNEDNSTVQDYKPLASRPTDLDLNSSYKSSRSRAVKGVVSSNLSHAKEVPPTTTVVEAALGAATYSALSTSNSHQELCPPSFPLPLRDTCVMYGSKAVLRCQITGNPKPEVKWLLNQKQIEPSKEVEIVYTDVLAQLTVRETYTEHVGDYACWARNTLGTVSSHCTLNLEVPNKTESRALEGRVFLPPKIVSFTQSSLSLPLGSLLTLSVTFVGEPRPIIRWMQGDRELTTDSHAHIVTDGNTSCLTIRSVTQSDAGKMSVCLTNCNGADQASVNISIEDVPGAPVGRPHIYDIDRNSASLSWYSPTSNERSQVSYYIIEAKTIQDQAWDVIVPHCKDLHCHILGLKPSTTYEFRILAANKHGLSVPSEPSEKVFTFDSIRSPSDYESEAYADVFTPTVEYQTQDDFSFEPREVAIKTTDKFEDVYELGKEVGKGKFGVVYKCVHKTDGTIWAAKIVKCREKDKGVIRREIDIMNKLRHPKLLLLWDAYESQRQMVLVMEFVGAGELFERVIGEDFVLTECDCVHFLRQICEGVNYMHSNNILHLDLKPENILCMAENSNRIKIIDFGLAQFHEHGQSTKVLFGTPEFIAPEVINYDEIGFVTDMWSIGVICYVLLSGLSPFLGDNDAETLANVTSGEFDFDDEAFDEISDEAKNFISQLLLMKKERRLLTDQCLAHVWLKQNEVGAHRSRRLNTDRLKRFMVRRKWLKTGNAVLAVSRLLKSSNLSSLSSNGNNSRPAISPLECNTKEVTENKIDSFSTETTLSQFPVEYISKDHREFVEEKTNIPKENFILRDCQDSSKVVKTSKSDLRITTSIEVLPENSLNVNELDSVSLTDHQTNSGTDQNDNQIVNENSLILTGADVNHNMKQTESLVFKHSDVVSSSTTVVSSKDRIHNRTELNQTSMTDVAGIVLHAPVFTKSMMNSTTCVGDVARFDVVVFGEPSPQVTWHFEDEEICSDSRHTVDFNQNSRTFSLIIRSIEEDDEGEYTCKAVNSQGESICVAELSVLEM